MINLPVINTSLRTYFYGQTSFWMEMIFLQDLLTEYLEKYNFLKIADANSIFADLKSIMQLWVRKIISSFSMTFHWRIYNQFYWKVRVRFKLTRVQRLHHKDQLFNLHNKSIGWLLCRRNSYIRWVRKRIM